MKSFFITGTDTEVGKTHVSTLLLSYLNQFNLKTVGYKPIAAGAERAFGELVNEDALSLMEASSLGLQYKYVNPYVFEEPIAPHIAAQRAGVSLDFGVLSDGLTAIAQKGADYTLVEGAGGWALPVANDRFLYEWVKAEKLPVILVVGMKLGCLNHALLTLAHINASGCKCVGWIANHTDPDMLMQKENIESLKTMLDVPLLAIAPHQEAGQKPRFQLYQALSGALELNTRFN